MQHIFSNGLEFSIASRDADDSAGSYLERKVHPFPI
jgi:hypothetical protein